MEVYKVAELWWWFGSMSYGLFHCRFFGLYFATFVFSQPSFFIVQIVLYDWVDTWCFFFFFLNVLKRKQHDSDCWLVQLTVIVPLST